MRYVALPDVLQSLGKRLLFRGTIHMPSIAGKDKLVVVALGGEDLRHILVGEDPVVHVVAHHIGIEQIPVPNFHPHSYRLCRTPRDEMLVKFPSAVWSFRTVRPLLINKCS